MRPVLVILAVLLCSQSGAAKKDPQRVIVRWKKGVAPSEVGASHAKKLKLSRTYREDVRPGETVNDAVKRLSDDERVEFAEPDYEVSVAVEANDIAAQQYALNKINLKSAWNITTGLKSTKVCIIDTGVDYNHPDLAGNVVPGFNAITNAAPGLDNNLHGTFVAGIVGARTNNGIGIAGVNWDVTLIPCKFMGASGVGFVSDAIQCIEYCDAQGAKIFSNSWSGGGGEALRLAIQNVCNKGALFVSAAGNTAAGGSDIGVIPTYPAAYNLDCTVTVASTDSNDALAATSNFGADVHLAAPGVGIYSTMMSTMVPQYDILSGTSFAAPHVSGVLALMMAASPATATAAQLRTALLSSVTKVAGLTGKVSTGGRLDAAAAVQAAKNLATPSVPTPQPVPIPAPTSAAVSPPPPARVPSSTPVPVPAPVPPAQILPRTVPVTATCTMTGISAGRRFSGGTSVRAFVTAVTDSTGATCSAACSTNTTCNSWMYYRYTATTRVCYLYADRAPRTTTINSVFNVGYKTCITA